MQASYKTFQKTFKKIIFSIDMKASHESVYIYLIVVGDGERHRRVKFPESPPK
jgi:hypothetical protein